MWREATFSKMLNNYGLCNTTEVFITCPAMTLNKQISQVTYFQNYLPAVEVSYPEEQMRCRRGMQNSL